MMQYLLYGMLACFVATYLLRNLLLVGYNHLKYKAGKEKSRLLLRDFIRKALQLRPLTQIKLEPKGYDFKIYQRFQRKFGFYYAVLWFCLFGILFLVARIYLNAF